MMSNWIWKEKCWRYRRQGVGHSSSAAESLVDRVAFRGDRGVVALDLAVVVY